MNLLDYNLFESDITIEVINGRYWDFILEKFDYEYYNRNKGIKIPYEYKTQLKSIENSIESKLNEINPILGEYYNDQNKRNRVINFNLIPTEHWYTKFFRKEFEDPRYTAPKLYEGVDIIFNNIKEITRLIDVGLILDKYRILIRSRESLYSEIVIFERINPKNYNIHLQTQMKGKEYQVDNKINRVVKLPPKLK